MAPRIQSLVFTGQNSSEYAQKRDSNSSLNPTYSIKSTIIILKAFLGVLGGYILVCIYRILMDYDFEAIALLFDTFICKALQLLL